VTALLDTTDGAEELEILTDCDTEFEVGLTDTVIELVIVESEFEFDTVNGADPDVEDVELSVDKSEPDGSEADEIGLEPDIETAAAGDEIEDGEEIPPTGSETVGGEEIPPAILPAVLDKFAGSCSKNESSSDKCAPLLESARVSPYLAAISPINNPNNEKHNAVIGVINKSIPLSPILNL
jgi:hypothetical protein